MNPAYQVNLPPGYPQSGIPSDSRNVPMQGVMPPLAYSPALYTAVNPTLNQHGSITGANGPAGAGGGLLYESSASPLMRSYGKGSPYVLPATHTSYSTGLNTSPAHTQSAYTHSLSQTSGGTLYSAQSAYPPGLIPGLAPPTNLLQAQQQQRQLYLQSTAQPGMNPALGMNPAAAAALAARQSPVQGMPVNQAQHYQYAMMSAPPAGSVYPNPTYYPSYGPVYHQNNGAIP